MLLWSEDILPGDSKVAGKKQRGEEKAGNLVGQVRSKSRQVIESLDRGGHGALTWKRHQIRAAAGELSLDNWKTLAKRVRESIQKLDGRRRN